MSISNDIARCEGVWSEEDGWREGCEDCLRRTDEIYIHDYQVRVIPPPLVAFECKLRIDP